MAFPHGAPGFLRDVVALGHGVPISFRSVAVPALGVALSNLDSDRLRQVALVGAVAAIASLGLSAVGLVVQSWCRIDDDDDDDDHRGDGDPSPA